jgi:hypothetical protein
MRYQILGRDQASGKSVEPFFVEADDEKDARNRATETGIVIDAVTVAPFAPPPAARQVRPRMNMAAARRLRAFIDQSRLRGAGA